jgi:serine/threonine protein kinase
MEALKPSDPNKVGKYRLIARLGGGGMGRVFLGTSPGGRQVAVKIIHAELADDKQFRERFSREIEAVRQVGGFHTAPVVDADPDADPPWMVTAYIQGPSLQNAITEHEPLSLDQVCTLGAELAEGLAAIHACGIVHRDLKPSNVILAEDGPRIIDFGIARTGQASRITMTGWVVGTYAYMSPEQLRGEVVGPASDVFSLGCTLAFAATAHAPFGDDSIASVVHRITSEPPDLTGLTDERGFRQLISECLAKSMDDRPTLADILTRLTEPEPGSDTAAVPAKPATGEHPPETGNGLSLAHEMTQTMRGSDRVAQATDLQRHTVRRVRRRTVAIVAGVAVVGLLGAVLGIVLSGGPKPHHQASGPSPSVSSSTGPSGSAPPALPEVTLHDPNGKDVYGVAFGSNGVLATGDGNGNSYVWNAASGKLVATLSDPNGDAVSSLAFNPMNDSFASTDTNGFTYVWNAASHRLTGTLQNPNGQSNDSVAFSPDGSSVASGNQDGTTYLWDVVPGATNATPATTFRDPGGKSVYGIAFSPDGSLLATGDTNGSVYLWNVANGKLTATFHDPDSHGLYDVAFSPDESLLAVSDTTSDDMGVVYLWNTASGKLTATLQTDDNSNVADVAFSPDGRFLAAADTSGAVDLWKVTTGNALASLQDPSGHPLIGVAFSPDGDILATTDTGNDTYIWNARWLNS